MKLKKKKLFQECNNTLKQFWALKTDGVWSERVKEAPNSFKNYRIQDRKIVNLTPMRLKLDTSRESYDGSKDAEKIFLDGLREESSWIATDLVSNEEELLIITLKEYKDVFA